MIDVKMPDMGEDAGDEASVSFWYFDEGESVEEGEDLLELITDKATFNVPAPVSGKLVEILVGEGDVVKVGEAICRMEEKGAEGPS